MGGTGWEIDVGGQKAKACRWGTERRRRGWSASQCVPVGGVGGLSMYPSGPMAPLAVARIDLRRTKDWLVASFHCFFVFSRGLIFVVDMAVALPRLRCSGQMMGGVFRLVLVSCRSHFRGACCLFCCAVGT